MRKIEEILRLHHECGRSNREIAQAVRASPTTVGDYLRRARLGGFGWPLPDGLSESALEAALFPPLPAATVKRPEPNWAAVHRQVGRSGVTLDLLWQEYRECHPDGYQYSGFCEHYRAFARALPVTLRQSHAPGERLFVDYSGQTVTIIDVATGEERQAQIFVAVLGASSYTYVEATWTQGLGDWIGSQVRCLEYLGGAPQLLVPDYVSRHIIGLLWPSPLCGVAPAAGSAAGRSPSGRAHISQSDSSHSSRSGSRCQTPFRGDAGDSAGRGTHRAMAASFMRMLTSA